VHIKREAIRGFAAVLVICIAFGLLWRWQTAQSGIAQLNEAIACADVKKLDALLTRQPWLANYHDSALPPLHLVILSSLLLDDDSSAIEMARTLVRHGADVNAVDAAGRTAAHLSAQLENGDFVAFLIGEKADLNKQTADGETPLHFAAQTGNEKIVKMLLDGDADADLQDKHGKSPVEYARAKGHSAVVTLLLGKSLRLIEDRSPFQDPAPPSPTTKAEE